LLIDIISNLNVKSIGGLELGAIPIAVAIAMKSYDHPTTKNLKAFIVRKSAKKHGLEKESEGNHIEPIIIVDDVITTGKSILQTIEKLHEHKVKISGVVCVLDREQGAEQLFKENNIEFRCLFKHSDFSKYIDKKVNEKRKKLSQQKQNNKLQVQSISH
jgi:orotate phosphoribosyltransferase